MGTETNKTISRILAEVRTTDDENGMRNALELLEESIFQSGNSFEEALRTKLPLRIARIIRDVLGDGASAASKKQTADMLREALGQVRPLRIEIAFEPNEETLERMSNWVKREVDERTVLEIRVDRTMVGGARLVFGGRYREIALGELLRKTLENERERVLAKLRESK